MHPDTRQVATHMRDFGLHLLGKAIHGATFSEIGRPFAHTLSVVEAAHGAEILIKARIAQEHPLLIFSKFPRSKTTNQLLSIKELFDFGQTLNYSELPEALWASTGYRMREVEKFLKFGILRNGLVHFASLNYFNAAAETFKFAFEIVDPMLQDFWKISVVEYCDYENDVIVEEGYLREQIDYYKVSTHPETNKEIMALEKEYRNIHDGT